MTIPAEKIPNDAFAYLLDSQDPTKSKLVRIATLADLQIGLPEFPAELQVTGKFSQSSAKISAQSFQTINYPADATVLFVVIYNPTNGSQATIILPDNPRQGQTCYVKDESGTSNLCRLRIIGSNSVPIDGTLEKILNYKYGSFGFIWSGSSWTTISSSGLENVLDQANILQQSIANQAQAIDEVSRLVAQIQTDVSNIDTSTGGGGGGGGGSGDVVGPSSATDNAIVRFDLTTGKLIQNSGVTINDSDNITTPGDIAVNGGDITTTAGTFNLVNAATTINLGSTTVTRTINVGTNATNVQTINIGTGNAANVVSIGSQTGAAASTIYAGTGDLNVGHNSADRNVNLGTGGNTSIQDVVVGSAYDRSSLTLRAGTGNMIMTGAIATDYTVGGQGGTGTITLGRSKSTNRIDIGNAGNNTSFTQTVNIAAGTGTSAVTIGSKSGTSPMVLQAGSTGLSVSGSARFNQGLSGSLTKLVDGTSYIRAGSNITVTTGSNGAVTISSTGGSPGGSDTHVQFNDGGATFGGDAGLTYNKSTDTLTVAGDLNINGGDIDTSATTFNLINSTATTLNIGGAALLLNVGTDPLDARIISIGPSNDAGSADTAINSVVNVGNTPSNPASSTTVNIGTAGGGTTVNSIFVGNYLTSPASTTVIYGDQVTFPQGLSGSLTKLVDGTSYIRAGSNITVTSASNGAVTISSTGGSPGGSDTQVQFNDGGTTFGGDAGLTYNKTSDTLTIAGDLNVNGGDQNTTASTFNLLQSASILNVCTTAENTVNIGTGASLTANTQTINLGTGAGRNVVSVGSISANALGQGSSLTLLAGSGNMLLSGAGGTTYTMGGETGTGTITIGRSTADQTINIGNVFTGSPSTTTTTINIGASGSGYSRNLIALGNYATAGGGEGASSVTVYGDVIDIGSAGAAKINIGNNTATTTLLGGSGGLNLYSATGGVFISGSGVTTRITGSAASDAEAFIGTAEIGELPWSKSTFPGVFAMFGHKALDHTSLNYALVQSNSGDTYLNAASGKSVFIANNGSAFAQLDTSVTTFSGSSTTTITGNSTTISGSNSLTLMSRVNNGTLKLSGSSILLTGSIGINLPGRVPVRGSGIHIKQFLDPTRSGTNVTDNSAALRIEDDDGDAWIIGAGESDSSDLYFSWDLSSVGGDGTSTIQGYVLNTNNAFTQMNFTGQHRCVPAVDTVENFNEKSGLIVIASGDYLNPVSGSTTGSYNRNIGINDATPTVRLASSRNDKRSFGVVSEIEDVSDGAREFVVGKFVSVLESGGVDDNRVFINAIGEGAIWVCNINGSLENGDYITTCEIPGYGMKQDDDLLHNYTVAKITCDCDFTLDNGFYQCEEFQYEGITYRRAFVGCTYHCG